MDTNLVNIVINVDSKGEIESFSLADTTFNSLLMRKVPSTFGVVETKCSQCFVPQIIEVFINALSMDSKDVKEESLPETPNCEIDDSDLSKMVTVIVKQEDYTIDENSGGGDDNYLDSDWLEARDKRKSDSSRVSARRRTVEEKFQCDTCPKSYLERASLKRHKKNCPRKEPLMCKKCGSKDFDPNRIMTLINHERYCTGAARGESNCDICHKTFAKWHYVEEHKNVVHLNLKAFCCEACGEKFKTKKSFDKHKFKHTDDPKPFQCDICKRKYPAKAPLREHILLKHIESYEGVRYCLQCNPPRRFLWENKLKFHEAQMHSDTLVTTCTDCGKTLKRGTLKSHIYRFHTPPEQKKRLACSYPGCNFTTAVKGSLEVHKFVHLEDSEKPYRCQFCTKGFPDRHNLERHVLIHTGARPFSCEVCHKAFSTKSTLTVSWLERFEIDSAAL